MLIKKVTNYFGNLIAKNLVNEMGWKALKS